MPNGFYLLSAVSILFNLVGPVQADDPARADDDVKGIIDKAIKAHGGDSKVAKLKIGRIKVKGKQSIASVGEAPFTLEDSWQLPNQYKTQTQFEVKGATVTQHLSINGDKGWMSLNKRTLDMDSKILGEMKEQLYAETLDKLFPLREKGYEISKLGESKVDGRAAVGIKIASKGHRDVSLYFDKETGLLVKRAHGIQDISGKEILQEVVFSDFKEVEGLKHYMKITAYQDGTKMLEGEVTEVKFFDKLDESVFLRPLASTQDTQKSEKAPTSGEK